MFDHRILSFNTEDGLLTISAIISSRDGRIIAEIRDGEFDLNPNNYFTKYHPDFSKLSVIDSYNNEAIYIYYMNGNNIKLRGIFKYQGNEVRITDDGIMLNGRELLIIDCARLTTGAIFHVGP
jgi:hypothetical protein